MATQVTTDRGVDKCATTHGGTSAAAPNAAGVFALALQVRYRRFLYAGPHAYHMIDPNLLGATFNIYALRQRSISILRIRTGNPPLTDDRTATSMVSGHSTDTLMSRRLKTGSW